MHLPGRSWGIKVRCVVVPETLLMLCRAHGRLVHGQCTVGGCCDWKQFILSYDDSLRWRYGDVEYLCGQMSGRNCNIVVVCFLFCFVPPQTSWSWLLGRVNQTCSVGMNWKCKKKHSDISMLHLKKWQSFHRLTHFYNFFDQFYFPQEWTDWGVVYHLK